MKAALIIHNGKVYASLTEKPEMWHLLRDHPGIYPEGIRQQQWEDAFKEWKDALLEVENAEIAADGNMCYTHWIEKDTICTPIVLKINPNQQAEIEPTEKGCIVTKLL